MDAHEGRFLKDEKREHKYVYGSKKYIIAHETRVFLGFWWQENW